MKRRHIPALAIPAGIVAALAVAIPATAHNASISCGSDGDVHAAASQYNDGVYVIDGGTPHPFHSGFVVTLDGGTRHTLSVTADDWPPFNDSAGPCRATTTTEGQPSTSTTPTSSSTASTSSTTATSTPTTPPTTATPSTPPSTESSTTSAPTTSSELSPPTSEQSPPSSNSQPGSTCEGLTVEQCNATETTEATSPAPSVASTSPSELTSPASTSPTSRSTAPGLPVTGPSPLAPEIAGIGFLALAAGTGAVVVARRRRP